MKVQNISRNITRFSMAVATATACLLNNSCFIKDERFSIKQSTEHENEYVEENPLKIFNNFAADIGLLNWPNGIEKAGAVSVESRDSSKIYCVYDNSLNTDNSDTLTLKQITVHPNNTISADTFLMYYNLGKLQVENKSKTIENVSLQKGNYKVWKEFRNNNLSAEWYKVTNGKFTRDIGKYADIYENATVTSPPEGY